MLHSRSHGPVLSFGARAAAFAVACVLLAGSASAQDFEAPKIAEARALFEEAMKLVEQGRHAEACPKFAASHKLDPGMGVLFRLAQCYESTGKLASAWGLYLQVADMAHAARMDEREKYARGRADALRVKLPKLLIVVPAEVAQVEGLEVKRDGNPLGKEQWGAAMPVDGGQHVISVGAPGKRQWQTTVEVSATGEGATLTVTIPTLKEEPSVGPVSGAGTAAASAQPVTESPGWGAQKIAGGVVAGAGAVGLILGGVLGGLAIGKNNEASSFCRPDKPTLCKPEGVALDKDVKTLGAASTAAFIAGGVLLAGGVVLFLTAPAAGAAPKSGSDVRVRVSGGRVALEGSW